MRGCFARVRCIGGDICAQIWVVYISPDLCVNYRVAAEYARMERYVGLEPTFAAWEADVLPLHQYRVYPGPPCRRTG